MKTYLNRAEREDYCVIALAAGKLEEMLKNWEKNLTPQEHRDLTTSKSYIYKFMDSIKNRVDKDFTPQLIRDLKCSEILVMPKWEAIQEQKDRKLEDGFVQVNKETILNLAGNALSGCKGCTKKDFRNCDLRQAFIELEIDPYDYKAKDICQYKI